MIDCDDTNPRMTSAMRVRGVEEPRVAPLEGASTYAPAGFRGWFRSEHLIKRFFCRHPDGYAEFPGSF